MYHVVIHSSIMRHRRRQERWLHTRISEDLEDALKREARRRRAPVSLLVRNLLESALDLVEDLVEDGLEIARLATGDDAADARMDDIYGWQELVLNVRVHCASCASGLSPGAHAFRGLRDGSGPRIFLCGTCVGQLKGANTEREETTS
jgi:hypothetical protein